MLLTQASSNNSPHKLARHAHELPHHRQHLPLKHMAAGAMAQVVAEACMQPQLGY